MLGTVEIYFWDCHWLHIARHNFLHIHHFPYYLQRTVMS